MTLSSVTRYEGSGKHRPSARAREVGERIQEARQKRGLTRKALATSIGVNLWMVEKLESGERDPDELLGSIAEATDQGRGWLAHGGASPPRGEAFPDIRLPSAVGDEGAGSDGVVADEMPRRRPTMARNAILFSLALLLVVRFFTEVFGFLPAAGNFIDIPLLGLLALLAATQKRDTHLIARRSSFMLPVFAFVLICTASVLANGTRVEPAPVLVFLYGFLGPVGFYLATYRLWPAGEAIALSRLLIGLGVLELLVVVAIDLPRFATSGNPDTISGTFGNNAYQLVFFLILFAALVAGIATFEAGTLTARLAPFLLGGAFLVIFLAQYRALLVATAICIVATALMLGVVRGRGFATGVIAILLLVVALSYVASHFPTTKFKPTVEAIRQNPKVFVDARLAPFDSLLKLYSDSPQFVPVGTGPGTYSSRAWRTFADVGDPANAEGAEQHYASVIMGGRAYHTDVSDKYVLPQIKNTQALLGSRVATAPYSSYTSLLAEVGLLGFLTIIAIYGLAIGKAVRLALTTMRDATTNDPLPALALATAISFLLLLQMGFLDNWLEVPRVTVPAWLILGVVTKEVDARRVSKT
jgi:DNA-binding XRE family transcriptional regulator